ncbi:MAG: hypothetical protein COA45_03145 [Zetaproteobacteria bacterium]|nr:MAG: hypothetical protein COA45_03145 [Zetaproteobacteria bacterium]
MDGLDVSSNPEGNKAKITFEDNGTTLLIDRSKSNKIKITDEHGDALYFTNDTFKTKNNMISDVSSFSSSTEFGIDDPEAHVAIIDNLGIVCRFNNDGTKAIFIEDLGQKVSFFSNSEHVQKEQLAGRFLHKISIDRSETKKWALPPENAIIFAKLIVAKDLNIEPNLQCLNELDEEKAGTILAEFLKEEYVDDWDGPEQWRPKKEGIKKSADLSKAEKKWDDTTEFTGYTAHLPTAFAIHHTNTGFDILTSSDNKDAIWTHGDILNTAQTEGVHPIQTINEKTAAHSLLHMLSRGHTTTNHIGQDWNFIVLESPAAKTITQHTNTIAQNNFGLTSNDYVALNYNENTCLIAMEKETLERVRCSYAASLEMIKLIEDNSQDITILEELIDQGADYKYIDIEAVHSGKTFSTIMKQYQSTKLLKALEEIQGGHLELSEGDTLTETIEP